MSIRRITENNYEVRLSMTVDGVEQLIRKRGFKTKRAAQLFEAEKRQTRNVGGVLNASRLTLNDHSIDWLKSCKTTLKPTTYASYVNALNAYILPTLGEIALRDLTTPRLQTWVNELHESGKVGGGHGGQVHKGEPLSAKSVKNIHGALHACLRRAVVLKRLAGNPADNVELPRWVRPEMRSYSQEQLASIVTTADTDERWSGIWWLLFLSGIRRGEVLGLTWSQFDLEAGVVRIVHNRVLAGGREVITTPKTERGKRVIELDEPTIERLREWRKTQMKERMKAGSAWVGGDLATCSLVTNPNGSPTHTSSFRRRYNDLMKRARVPAYTLHEARHTSITLLAPYLPPHVLSRRAGHSSVSFTLDRYAHAMPQESRDAVNLLAESLTRRHKAAK